MQGGDDFVKQSKTDKQSIPSEQVVRVSIETDAQLADTLSDHLVGMYDAAVEFVVDQPGANTVVHGFLKMTAYSDEKRLLIERQIADYALEIADIFQVPRPYVQTEIIADQDWSEKWKEYFKPFEIIPDLIIAPSWEPFDPPVEAKVITMDPGMAFGTGHHATTRLCLRMLQDAVRRKAGCSLLDVGTGTGILGMAAVLFGAGSVLGVDNDQDAVSAARENVSRNALQDRMRVSGRGIQEIDERYDLVVANIVHDVLAALADDLSRLTLPGGGLVLSGLIHGEQTESMKRCFLARGFTLSEELLDGEWGALRLKKIGEAG